LLPGRLVPTPNSPSDPSSRAVTGCCCKGGLVLADSGSIGHFFYHGGGLRCPLPEFNLWYQQHRGEDDESTVDACDDSEREMVHRKECEQRSHHAQIGRA